MTVRRPASTRGLRAPKARARSRSTRAQGRTFLRLLDDDIDEYTVQDWRARNLRLVEELIHLDLFDPEVVPREAHLHLTESLIQVLNGAATDPQNAGHVRAQNENVLHFGLAAAVPKATLTIALEAAFIHDLNKAVGERLRQDEWSVRDRRGRALAVMTSMAQIVGLNHLGERTRGVIEAAVRLPAGALDPEVARSIDRTIIHHGLGSSRFIGALVDGKNAWWGSEFVDPATGERRLYHPIQPPLTLESVIHDLADSTQQMQGGAAWLMKYPAGFWRGSGRSLRDMLSGSGGAEDGGVPMSLAVQIEVETATCRGIIESAVLAGIVDRELAERLALAVEEAIASSRRWIDGSPDYLAGEGGESAYHDLARALGISPEQAVARLEAAISGTQEADELIGLLWTSGRRVDLERARALTRRICGE